LIHPTDGLKRVQVGPVEFSESNFEGAILKFSTTFYEAGSNEFPAGTSNKAAILGEKASAALEKSKSVFDKAFSVAKMPGFAVASARKAIANAQKSYNDATKGVADVANEASKLAYSTRNLVAQTNDLLSSPSKLSQRLLDSFSLLGNTISNVKLRTAAYASFYSFGSSEPAVVATTPVRKQEATNQKALNDFIIQVAVVNSAVSAQQTDFESTAEAEAKRDEIVSVLEKQIRNTTDTELYQALMDVKAALIDALPDPTSEMPSIKKVTTDGVTTSLHLAYELFEDSRKESDIIARNKIVNPALIPPGTELEVLDV
jgi:prophage DNA circulation protein